MMNKPHLKKKIHSLNSFPKQGLKDMSFIDEYSDEKIHDICEACYNIVHKKLPLDSKKKSQLKKKLLPIHKEIRKLANPNLKVLRKRNFL